MTPQQNRDLNDLAQAFRTPLERWLAAVKAAGFAVMVYETARTRERQEHLYAQGRTRPGAIITYTLDSCHRYRIAADWAPLIGGAISWNAADYQRIYAAVPPERFGLEKLSFEMPHLQLIGGQRTAVRLGIRRDTPQRSVWPLPAPRPTPIPALPPPLISPTPPAFTVTLIDEAGQPVTLADPQAIYGGVLIVRTAQGVTLDKTGGR